MELLLAWVGLWILMAWLLRRPEPAKSKIGDSFQECGSYYPVLTYADELWDPFYHAYPVDTPK
jgi:hypothetical protein